MAKPLKARPLFGARRRIYQGQGTLTSQGDSTGYTRNLHLSLTFADNLDILVSIGSWDGRLRFEPAGGELRLAPNLGGGRILDMFSKTLGFQYLLVALILSWGARPALAQEQVYESGRIVQIDERGEALDFLDEEDLVVDTSLPWIPVLSPVMICLDCWIGKTVKIHEHYSQQAAERYFAHIETCTDIPLGLDSGYGANTKYTILAPFYAGCPALLQNGGFWGWVGRHGGYGTAPNYGFQEPMPSPVTTGPQGTTLMSPPAAGGMELMPAQPAPAPVVAPAPPVGSVQAQPINQVASGSSKWANMSDSDILNYFGLDSAAKEAHTAELVGELDQPVAPASTWEFADQSAATSAASLMAQAPAVVGEQQIPMTQTEVLYEPESPQSPSIDDLRKSLATEKKEFSVTDKEYEKMREIEGNLLGDL